MKIRSGFVSNSSSGNYMATIRDISLNLFIDYMLKEYAFSFFNKEDVLNELKSRLMADEHQLYELQGGKDDILFEVCKLGLEKSILDGKNAIEKINIIGEREMVECVLALKGIGVSEDKQDDSVTLTHNTSMHNNFTEGMNDLMKEIVLYFMFDTKHKVICKRTSDQLQ